MNVYLESDFHDYYDHMFDTNGAKFERMSVTDLSRGEAFTKLTNMGLAVPAWGGVSGLNHTFPPETRIVVYIDHFAHRGEDKELMSIREAMARDYSGKTASIYVPNLQPEMPRSDRYLRIGGRIFWLTYISLDEWQSNRGNVSITELPPPRFLEDFGDNEPLPMLAIDFVKCMYGGWLAVDYNTAPGLRHTPVEDALNATEVVGEVKKFMMGIRHL